MCIRDSCCELAARGSVDYVWIDTCCIDKKSSAELSEAINSMWRYYTDATVCYAHLADVPYTEKIPYDARGTDFGDSEWFTRGWTLQELIAPVYVRFYSKDWRFLGTKSGLAPTSAIITGIPPRCLDARNIRASSVARRMSFASNHVTTRTEHVAYCLMELMDVNIPLLYGEGSKAFKRLQEEIIRDSDDQTVLA